MAIIDPNGLFGGDRLRRCSNAAQLHWPRLFLASDGFGRVEINYARLTGRAYSTFNPVPTEAELQACVQDYAKNYLLFLYEVDGRVWGQWDTRSELLPRYKTAQDRRSPIPPEGDFSEWKRRYRAENRSVPKCFGNISESFLHGVGVGVGVGVGKGDGKNTCASSDARGTDSNSILSVDNPPFNGLEPDGLFPGTGKANRQPQGLTPQQEIWFNEWWDAYWLRKAKKAAREAFRKHVTSEERFQQIMAATRAQSPEMLTREPSKRPMATTWLNGERWNDEVSPAQTQAESKDGERDEVRRLLARKGDEK